LKCSFKKSKYKHQISPFYFYIYNDDEIHFFALSSLFYFQKTFAIEQFNAGLLGPQASIATAAFFFRVAIGSISTALPHNYELLGHALRALERRNSASLILPFTY
jgi:hypothetical protein